MFRLVVVVVLWLAPLGLLAQQRPNVLLIMTDDQGYGDLSGHGNPHLQTPHLDELAREAVQFERFYVNSFCAPTRAALLTGRYPLRCGVWGVTHSKETMRASEVTIAEALKPAGYRTACIGKWHNGEQFPYTPPGQGFDEFFGFCHGHTNNYFNATLLRGSTPEPTKGYISDVLTDEALRFIGRNRKSPFFCYLSYNAPHSPYQIPDKYYDKFRKKGFDERTAGFWGMCENIDDNIGRLLAKLDEFELSNSTIVVFLTDNGGTAGVRHFNAGMRGGKTSVHEGGCRVPLFIRWPAKLKPRTVKQLASHIDLYPTLLDLCGFEPPQGPTIDGVNLRPLLEGNDGDWPERTIYTHNPISADNRYPGAVRTSRYRLVRSIRGRQGGSSATPNDKSAPPWQLYDMHNDPGEKNDLAKKLPEVVVELSQQYEAWYDAISQQPLIRLPIQIGHTEENPVTINAPQAYLDGKLRFDHGPGFAHDWLTDWDDERKKVWFEIDVVRGGRYELFMQYGLKDSQQQPRLVARIGENKLATELPFATAAVIPLPHRDQRSRERYVNRKWGKISLGELDLARGRQRLEMRLIDVDESVDLKSVTLQRLNNASN